MAQPKPDPAIRAVIEGDVHGQVAIGQNIVQIGTMHGGVVVAGDRPIVPVRRPSPVFVRPRPFPGFLNRETEIRLVSNALDEGSPTRAWGEDGVGKTVLLRHLAHQLSTEPYPDGLVFLSVEDRPLEDIAQLLFELYHEVELPFKAKQADLVRGLQELRALVLLDDVQLSRSELIELLNLAPSSGFLVSSTVADAGGELRDVKLAGLPTDKAVELVGRQLGRSLNPDETDAARRLSEALYGHPLAIIRAATTVRDDGRTLAQVASSLAAEARGEADRAIDAAIDATIDSLDEDERKTLAVIAVLRGAPWRAELIADAAGVSDIDRVLSPLIESRLVVASSEGIATAVSLEQVVPEEGDRERWIDRVLALLARVADEADAAARVAPDARAFQAAARVGAESRDWGAVRSLVRALGLHLPLAALWGAWSEALGLGLEAARSLNDVATEAWALHESGTRALGLDDHAVARERLGEALRIREQLGDEVGAAVTRHNLGWLPLGGEPDADEGGSEGEGGGGDGGMGWSTAARRVAAAFVVGAVGAGLWYGLSRNGSTPPGPGPGPDTEPTPVPVPVPVPPPEPPPAPELALEPGSIAFGDRPVGAETEPVTVGLRNSGTADLGVGALRLTTALGPASFILADDAGCARSRLAPGAECAIQVVFAPARAGVHEATLVVENPFGDPIGAIDLTGRGTVGVARVRLLPVEGIEFPNVDIGATDPPMARAGIENSGTAPLSVRGVRVVSAIDRPGARFFRLEMDECSGRTVEPGETCIVVVAFDPRAAGNWVARLEAHDDAEGSPRYLDLAGFGTGQGRLVATPPAVGFAIDPNTLAAVVIRPQTIQLSNAGPAEAFVRTVTIGGPHPADFRIEDGCSRVQLVPGDSCLIEVSFTPQGSGPRIAELQVDAFLADPIVIPLQGPGGAPPAPPPPPGPREPDLIIREFRSLGPPRPSASGVVTLPVRVTVLNRGGVPASGFKVAVVDARTENPIALTVAGEQDRWYPRLRGLGPGDSATFDGTLAIRSAGGVLVLVAIADSCSGEEFVSDPPCFVSEADESNNRSGPLRVDLP